MKIQISMSTRDHAAYADGAYTDGKTIVKAGGMISKVFRGLNKIAAIRNDSNNVSEDGRILRDCEFNTPSEAAQFVIDCEFAVLNLYANGELWKEAWQRYYRLIFRDSYSRLDMAAKDIKSSLDPLIKKQKDRNENEVMNELLLEWVQNMEYKRDSKPQKIRFYKFN